MPAVVDPALIARGNGAREVESPLAVVVVVPADIRRLSSGAEPLGLGNGLAEAIPRVLAIHQTVRVEVADLRADPEVEQVAYFVVSAAVGNAIMHAGPGATVNVTITDASGPPGQLAAEDDHGQQPTAEFLAIEVRDNGLGGADTSGHGLTLMAERVIAIGGTLNIISPVGIGTVVSAILPRRNHST